MRGTVGMVAGDGGIGKSLLMQQLATCACLGRAWLGLRVEPVKAMVLACEDDEGELFRRQTTINLELSCDMDEIAEAGLVVMPRVGEDNALMRFDRRTWKMTATDWLSQLRVDTARFGVQLVIIDTATQTFIGNQNDETQVMEFVTVLRKWAIEMNGAVILTKHPSMSGRNNGSGESGNVAWNNSVRSRFYMHKDKGGDLLFECKKSNYGKQITLKLRWDRGVYRRDEPVITMPYAD